MKRKRSDTVAVTTDERVGDAPAPLKPARLRRALAPATAAFASASPFVHVQLASLFDKRTLMTVRDELGLLQRTFKETDLFKLFQTGDLANLDAANVEHAKALPAMIKLRAALYSDAFRSFVRSVTGCAPLTAKQDMSCNVYRRGGHLLCHDDVIGTRCVSYILYLSRPHKQWKPSLGGALELYTVSAKTGAVRPAPVRTLAPEFGTLVFFTVQPGVSYHAVQEVRTWCQSARAP
jgi:Rps23 Pro-64 3,4-dihydroxylase Tpa1-like proline 4-hydroxylase